MSASGQLRLRIMISGYAIIIYSANNYLLIKTSVPSSAWCSCNFIINGPGHGRVWEIKVNASGAAGCEMLIVGWMEGCPKDTAPVLAPSWMELCPATHGQKQAGALTWRHRALMMIDRVVFFISLNPISACCNLSNDGSLLAIAGSLRASLFYPTGGPCGTALKDQWFASLFAYTLLIWKSYCNCEVQINGDASQVWPRHFPIWVKDTKLVVGRFFLKTFFRGIRKIKHDWRHYNGHHTDFDKQLLDLINRLKMRFTSAKISKDGDIFNLIQPK